MFFPFLNCLLLFFMVTFGLAWPVAARLKLAPAEKLVASAVLSLLGVYLVAFGIYLLRLPLAGFWILPMASLIGLAVNRSTLGTLGRDENARALLIGQLLVTGWCVGWLFFIASYIGGGWTSDWYEHWERALFFTDHWPLDAKFLGIYALPARPPLANLVTGAWMALTARSFANYQLFTALLNTLAFLPAGLLVRRFQASTGSSRPTVSAVAVLVLLLLLNPSFVENATFAWTKLITVFFVLSGLYFFLRTQDADAPRAAGPLCAVSLAAGVLTHYSAGPFVLLLVLAWPILNRKRWTEAGFWRQTAGLGLLGALVLATWFGWSLAAYGVHTTLLSNSSVIVPDAQAGNQWLKIALNLRDTLVPHFLRPLDGALIAQTSRWGYWHDWFFQLYQLNLLFVFGSVGWLVLGRELGRGWGRATPQSRRFWVGFAGGAILLGVAVHGARDTWGLAHICLQTIVVLGLAYLAARWSSLGRGWRFILWVGASLDFCLGIALHFAVESYGLDHWFTPDRPFMATLRSYAEPSLMNAAAKLVHHLQFFRDVFPAPAFVVLVLLASILGLTVARIRSK
ncbi:MAG: hypothetical protein ABI222_02640 [Opitutaceae bacterium]